MRNLLYLPLSRFQQNEIRYAHVYARTDLHYTFTVKQACNHHQMEKHSNLNTYHLAALGIQTTSDLCLSVGSEALACYQFGINLSSCLNFHHKSNHIHSHLCRG